MGGGVVHLGFPLYLCASNACVCQDLQGPLRGQMADTACSCRGSLANKCVGKQVCIACRWRSGLARLLHHELAHVALRWQSA